MKRKLESTRLFPFEKMKVINILRNVIDKCFCYFSQYGRKHTTHEMLNVVFLESVIFQREQKYIKKYIKQHVDDIIRLQLTNDIRFSFVPKELHHQEKTKVFPPFESENDLVSYIQRKQYQEATYHLVTLALHIWHESKLSENIAATKLLVFTEALQICLDDLTPITLNLHHHCVESAKCKLYFLTHYILCIFLYGLKSCSHDHPCYENVIVCFKFLLRAWKILAFYPTQNQELILEIYWIYLIICKNMKFRPGPRLQELVDISQLTLAAYLKEVSTSLKTSKKNTKVPILHTFSWSKYKIFHKEYHTAILALFIICDQNTNKRD